MKVYHKATGQEYNGEPVDCRELLASGSYQSEQPTEEQMEEEAARREAARREAARREAADEDVTVRAKKPAAKKVK